MDSIFSNYMYDNLSEVKASLLLCTYNRSHKLSVFLKKLSQLSSKYSYELIFIDNNSTDHTRTILEEFVGLSTAPACCAMERRKGTGYGRNRAAAVARGEYLIYIDDDCYPDPSLIDEHIKLLDENLTLGFVGGRVELFDQTDLPMTILTEKKPRTFPAHSRLRAGDIISANMSIRRSAFDSVSGWDNLFGAGTPFPCEDLDIAARLLASGWDGLYHPSPMVYHHHERKTPEDAKALMASYDAGRGGFYAKALVVASLRKIYFWPWLKSVLRKDPRESFRELKSFSRYLLLQLR